ncbi:MAG: hypothetical protein IKN04_13560 [Clostridia bacterium]|nr:hypothetical protein [Clostridia bacterium]
MEIVEVHIRRLGILFQGWEEIYRIGFFDKAFRFDFLMPFSLFIVIPADDLNGDPTLIFQLVNRALPIPAFLPGARFLFLGSPAPVTKCGTIRDILFA